MTPLEELLKELRELFKETRDKANSVGDAGTPSQQDKDAVGGWLNDAGSDLSNLHDSGTEPSLTPASAGSVQSVSIPSSRLQTCQDAYTMADEAYTEILKGADADHDYIGDRTRTIQVTYIPEIREDFGIT